MNLTSVWGDVVLWPMYVTAGGVVLAVIAAVALAVWAFRRLRKRGR